ncbi:protein serine threonine phosphatase 2C [Pluteus cervinus]|uniref:Protein serine threonine phosphatase 2C n=1 Tax=Pluteus cervinus TaxID=181527 RepID=A0ACD3BCH2_9AGAR|nr:protein serine threonine phosphatase 2C [Pluteus cervinus]
MIPAKKQTDMGMPGEGPWNYTPLTEPTLKSQLGRMSSAASFANTDLLTFQPCPNPDDRNQDRHIVVDWHLPNGIWQFRGIFDGHAGHDAVDYTVTTLPQLIHTALQARLSDSANPPSTEEISAILTDSVVSIDEQLTRDILKLFPSPDAILALSATEIFTTINDHLKGGQNAAVVTRCMRGTTVLFTLLDPSKSNLWVASLGDCQAVLGKKALNREWEIETLSSHHNGSDAQEAERVRQEHPGEWECILNNRVLGALAVTRAIGDHLFKLPRVYTEKVFLNAQSGFRISSNITDFIGRNLTPPYVSNVPDIRHVELSPHDASRSYLVMCSDGLLDLYEDQGLDPVSTRRAWMRVIEEADGGDNLALNILKDALGGEDVERVSRMMTVEMFYRWMDDTTILVQRL